MIYKFMIQQFKIYNVHIIGKSHLNLLKYLRMEFLLRTKISVCVEFFVHPESFVCLESFCVRRIFIERKDLLDC